ncbi:unnamed protein product [Pleuronectes platessa]|uniref:Uncharacterized protein n=1 Tax=Pleuronectes platessa TaxID=8262 RepID=A0A9N7UGA7_PLEPL|nr:unnamed protein product [Pleuronectes platessa]
MERPGAKVCFTYNDELCCSSITFTGKHQNRSVPLLCGPVGSWSTERLCSVDQLETGLQSESALWTSWKLVYTVTLLCGPVGSWSTERLCSVDQLEAGSSLLIDLQVHR